MKSEGYASVMQGLLIKNTNYTILNPNFLKKLLKFEHWYANKSTLKMLKDNVA